MYNPFTEEDIYDIKNMLDDIEELENSYYNLDGEYPIKNENDPLVDKRIRRIVTSCLSSSYDHFDELSEYDKERIITPSGDENKKIKTNISISNKILEHDSDIRFKNF